MGNRKRLEEQLVDPSSFEFKEYLEKIDPRIDVNKFLSMAKIICSEKFQALPAEATEARAKAHDNNVNFEIAVTMTHDPEFLVKEYFRIYKPGSNEIPLCDEDHYERVLCREKMYVENTGLSPIEVTPDIDKPGHNGMTQLGQVIMVSDDVDKVRDLIENEGASPFALCGEYTPIYLAEQLGREKIVIYLQNIQKTSI